MQRANWIAVIGHVSVCAIVAWFGCSPGTFVGSSCAETEHCYTDWNYVGGSTCDAGKCTCPSGQAACCPGGLKENCKASTDYVCRPATECAADGPECMTADTCPGPPDPRCGVATCEDGKCGLAINFPGPALKWDTPGDCRRAYCDQEGYVIYQEDPSDVPISANSCVVDVCQAGQPAAKPVADKTACIDTPGVCLGGACVACVAADPLLNDCTAGKVCSQNHCVPPSCDDGVQSPGESDTDCGGPVCVRCEVGRACTQPSDCAEGLCSAGVCQAPTHADGVKNYGETGKDCGCDKCAAKCKDGEGCVQSSDCQSGVCYGGKCQAPSCFDDVRNGTEEGTDCGGPCALACSGGP